MLPEGSVGWWAGGGPSRQGVEGSVPSQLFRRLLALRHKLQDQRAWEHGHLRCLRSVLLGDHPEVRWLHHIKFYFLVLGGMPADLHNGCPILYSHQRGQFLHIHPLAITEDISFIKYLQSGKEVPFDARLGVCCEGKLDFAT